MKSFRLLAVLLLLAGSASATQINVSSVPSTITTAQNNCTLNVTGDLYTNGPNAFIFSGSAGQIIENVTIDFHGYTVKFDSGGTIGTSTNPGSGARGVNLSTNAEVRNVVIKNGYLRHAPPQANIDNPLTQVSAATIYMGSTVHDFEVYNMRLRVAGRNSSISWSGGGPYNVYYHNNIYEGECSSWGSRDLWEEQTMIFFDKMDRTSSNGRTGFQYHFKMNACSVSVAYWANLHLGGDSSVFEIYDNAFIVDAWNRLYGVIDLGGRGMTLATEEYAIAIRQSNAALNRYQHGKVYNNRIRSGTAHYGGRGIFVSSNQGKSFADNECIWIHHNTINIHQGWDGYTTGFMAFIVREQAWKYIRFEDNDITTTCYHNPPDSSYGPGSGIGIRITSHNDGSLIWVKRNTVRSVFADAFTFNPSHSTGAEAAYCVLFDSHEQHVLGVDIDSNTFITDNVFVRWGYVNGNGGHPNFRWNTFQYADGSTWPTNNNTYVAYMGYGGGEEVDAHPNVWQDCIFQNSINDEDIYMYESGSELRSISMAYTLSTQVIGSNNLPVRGATVTYRNAYGTVVYIGTTGTNGRVSAVVPKIFVAGPMVGGGVDSTGYNPYTVTATLGSATESNPIALAWNNKSTSLTLTTVAGMDSLVYSIEHYVIDSSTTIIGNTIGIPRFQVAPLAARGALVVLDEPGYPLAGKVYELYYTDSLERASWATRWKNKAFGGTPAGVNTSYAYDHTHLSVTNDTVYGGTDQTDHYMAWNVIADSLRLIFSGTWPYNPHNLAIWRLPNSDTALAFGRWSPEPNALNISYAISANRGQTFGGYQTFPNGNWAGVGHNIRYGGGRFNNTVFAAFDSANNGSGGHIRWWEWDRLNSSWVDFGRALTIPQRSFHAFACNGTDTMRFVAGTVEDATQSGVTRDSICLSIRGRNATSWTRLPSFTNGRLTNATGCSPYVGLTNIDSTDGMVMFYNSANVNLADSSEILMRYWIPSTGAWSDPPVKVSRGYKAWKVSTAFQTPVSHGNVAYAQIPFDSVIGGTVYHFTEIVKVRLIAQATSGTGGGPEPPVDPPVDPPVNAAPGQTKNIRIGSGVIFK